MADVFISYSRLDRASAERLDQRLRADGLSTWWDASLVAGDAWNEEVRRQLRDAKCVVVLWSEQSWPSRWVQAEAHFAFERGILVSARLDSVSLEAPFNIIQTGDLRSPSGLDEVVLAAREMLSPVKAARRLVRSSTLNSRRSLIVVSAIAALTAVAALVTPFLGGRPPAERPQLEPAEPAAHVPDANAALRLIDQIPGSAWLNDTPEDLLARVVSEPDDSADLRQAAETDARAQVILGLAYEYGLGGFGANMLEACRYHGASARQGNTYGQVNFSTCLLSGNGARRDVAEGLRMLEEAHNAGNAQATFSIANQYIFGSYRRQDRTQAQRFMRIASARGYLVAREAVQRMEQPQQTTP